MRRCLWPRWCSGRRARPLCVPVGGGPPASRPRCGPRLISGRRGACPPARCPRCELRSARRLEARPGPAGPASASNRARLVAVSGPPWSGRPRGEAASLRSAPRLEARTGPATAHRHRVRSLRRPPHQWGRVAGVWLGVLPQHLAGPRHYLIDFARNSLMALSNPEFRSLELQRFQTLLNVHPIELRAIFLGAWPHRSSNFACNSLGCVSWCEA